MADPITPAVLTEQEAADLRMFAATMAQKSIAVHGTACALIHTAERLLAEPFSPSARRDAQQAIKKARAEFVAMGGVL